MPRFTKLNPNTYNQMTWDAGIIVGEEDFDPVTGKIDIANIQWATTGTNSFTARRDLVDMGEGVNNAPTGVMQLQKARPWEVTMTGTAVTVTPKQVAEFLGGGEIDPKDATHIIPKESLSLEDFVGKYLIMNYSEKNGENNGGFMAIHIMNALSTEGFQGNFDKEANGQFPYTLRAFYDINDISKPPFDIYLKSGTAEA